MPTRPIESELQLQPQLVDVQVFQCRGLPKCSACGWLAFNAYETPHSCQLCGRCYQRCCQMESMQPCPGQLPTCQEKSFRFRDCIVDQQARRQLSAILVYCPNYSPGSCDYAGPYGKLVQHLELECQQRWLNCSRCGRRLRFQSLISHQNSDECRQILLTRSFGKYDGIEKSIRRGVS